MAMEVSWRTECSMGSNWEYPWNGQEPGYKSLQITQEPLEGNEHDSEAFLKLAGLKLERSDHWCEIAPFKVMFPKTII